MRGFLHKFVRRHGHPVLEIDPVPASKPAPSPPPASPPSVFDGVGAFTYGSPEVVLPYLGQLDWVAVLPTADVNVVAKIQAGSRLLTWFPDAASATQTVPWASAGLILQAETPDQLTACQAVLPSLLVPAAIVGNPTVPAELPAGATWLNECYENANPQATILGLAYEAGKRNPHSVPVLPCFGMYHEGDEGTPSYVAKKPLAEYLTELDAAIGLGLPASWCFWTAEQLDQPDWQALEAWRAKQKPR